MIKRPRVALIFDSENSMLPHYVAKSINLARKNGTIVLKAAFGFANSALQDKYREYGIIDYSRDGKIHRGKNSTDYRIFGYALKHKDLFDCCVIVSNNSDFATIFKVLKKKDKRVVAHATQKRVSRKLQMWSDELHPLFTTLAK